MKKYRVSFHMKKWGGVVKDNIEAESPAAAIEQVTAPLVAKGWVIQPGTETAITMEEYASRPKQYLDELDDSSEED